MKYRVKNMFKDVDGAFRRPGDTVEIDDARANKMRKYGFIGGMAETARIPVPGQILDVFSKMSRKELLRLAEEKGIEISKFKKAKKDDIIALLKECENSLNKEGDEDHDEGTEEEEEQNKEAGNGDEEPD